MLSNNKAVLSLGLFLFSCNFACIMFCFTPLVLLPAILRNVGTRHAIYAQSNLNNVPSLSPAYVYGSLPFCFLLLARRGCPSFVFLLRFLLGCSFFLPLRPSLSLDLSMAVLVKTVNAVACLALIVSVAASPCQKRGASSGGMIPAVANNSAPLTTPAPVNTPAAANTPVPVNTPAPANTPEPTNTPATPNIAVAANTPASANLCGNDQHIIIDGTPWLVANSMYGAAQMVGSVCTQFDRVETPAGGNPRIVWGSKTAIQYVEST